MNAVGQDLREFKETTLVHELLHVLNNLGDQDLVADFEKKGAVFDKSLSESEQISNWLAGGCPKK